MAKFSTKVIAPIQITDAMLTSSNVPDAVNTPLVAATGIITTPKASVLTAALLLIFATGTWAVATIVLKKGE